MPKHTPCDTEPFDCPFNAQYGEDCRYYCGLGVDEDEQEDYEDEDYEEVTSNQCLAEEETTHTPKIKMTNAQFNEFYKKQLEDLRAECDQMVADGECDQEYANFRYYMKMDEILWLSEDDIEIIDEE